MKFVVQIFIVIICCCTSCNNKGSNKQTPLYDTFDYGTINISVDESFKPVIEEQLQMYHFTYPNTNIKVSYKSEVECFKDLLNDSVRMIISARSLSSKEFEIFKNNLYIQFKFSRCFLLLRPLFENRLPITYRVFHHSRQSFFRF